jgi:Flp pilus assembly pilin Flp
MKAVISIQRFFEKKGEDGQTAAEYALILVLIAVAVIVSFQFLASNINNTLSSVGTTIGGTGS